MIVFYRPYVGGKWHDFRIEITYRTEYLINAWFKE